MKSIIFSVFLFTAVSTFAQAPAVLTLDAKILEQNKLAYLKRNSEVVKKVKTLINIADKYLSAEPHSVMDKSLTPSSKNKHDYMSLGPYWWPDPSKPDGLPYIRKDGQRNPEIKKITDRDYLGELETRCKYLALAYYFTEDEKYAKKAVQLLNVWFINPETKMNPNLNFGQAIPGLNDGRGIGIIESRLFVDVLNWVALLQPLPGFKDQELPQLKAWFKEYLNWMQTSKNGVDESQALNNHGTYYELQVAAFAAFTKNKQVLDDVYLRLNKRMEQQFKADGEQPLELERTNALGYSTMNLSGWFDLALLGDNYNYSIWSKVNEAGGGLEKAFNWLIPYVKQPDQFPFQQITEYHRSEFYHLILIAEEKFKSFNAQDFLSLFHKDDPEIEITDLLYLKPGL